MRPIHPILALLLLLPACASSNRRAPTAAELAEVCARIRCRPPTSLQVPVDETHAYALDFPASPWVAGPGLISLLPGETITITGTVDDDGRLVDLVVVDNTPEPTPNTIVLEFSAPELGHAMLTVQNNFDTVLVYEAAMFLAMEDRLFATTAIPVQPHVFSMELWSDPITQLALSNFHFPPPT